MLTDDERKDIEEKNAIKWVLFFICMVLGLLIVNSSPKDRAGAQGAAIILLLIVVILAIWDPWFGRLRTRQMYEWKINERMFDNPDLLNVKELLAVITDLETVLQTLESNYSNKLISETKYVEAKNLYSERLDIYYKKLHEIRGPD